MSVKLTYFNLEGAAEKVRLALAMTGTTFEDKRIEFDEWKAVKPTTPCGTLPVMEIDGRVMTQSPAMLRWAGKRGDGSLYPDEFMLDIEEMIGLSDDLGRAEWPCMHVAMRPERLGHSFASDEEKKAKVKVMREKFLAEDLPKFMGFFTKILESKGNRFFCGDKVTIADLQILPQLRLFTKGTIDFVPVTVLDQFPAIKAWIERMMAIPEIKAWYNVAPKEPSLASFGGA